ncbi:MAG: YadA C-terminal domain-containing protein, partial [Gammaproteobacteria bacterium]|nr:YadA C-terminal domain-containing protein [Gammaproteobacteria bacterium]
STNITTNSTNISTNTTGIATNSTNITTNSTNISTNTTGIATNSTNITTNTTNIATNSTNIATNTTNIAKNSTRIDDLEDESRSGIAAVAAMAAIPAPMNGRKFSVGLGAGHFNGESAIAAGFNARLTDSMTLTGGVGGNGDEVATSLGIGFSW